MMEVTRYTPAFVERDEQVEFVSSKEELLKIPWVAKYAEMDGFMNLYVEVCDPGMKDILHAAMHDGDSYIVAWIRFV